MTNAWPVEIRRNAAANALRVSFDDGAAFDLPAELLRVMSPSAEVQGHTPSERKLVTGKRSVKIVRIDAAGNYAIRIAFDDGHDTGLYTWAYLRELGEGQAETWAAYLSELTTKGLGRG